MQDYLLKNNDLTNPGRKYAQSEASEKISEASSLPREGRGEGGGPDDGESQPLASRTQVLQALGVIRWHCAMKPIEKIEEGGRKALAYTTRRPGWWCRALETRIFTRLELFWLQMAIALNI
jgi:hypothetical protein